MCICMHLEVLKHNGMLTVTIVTMLKTSNKARCVRLECHVRMTKLLQREYELKLKSPNV